MKKHLLKAFIGIIGVCMLLSSCDADCELGSGNIKQENRKVSDFTKIDVSGKYRIVLVQDSSLSLNISADDNLLEHIKTSVTGDVLHITSKNICSDDIAITIGVRNLEEVHASGSVDISSTGNIHTSDLNLKFSGSTKITLDLNAARVSTKGSGSTEINLKGQATTHDIDLSGSGNVNALDFVVGDYNISTSGSSDCQINVLRELNVHSSGSSSIQYRGNPTQVSNHKSGSSSIEKIN
jgi:hypothetical protein